MSGEFDIPECWLLVTGGPFDSVGMRITGPFDSAEDVTDYAELHHSDEVWWVLKTTQPLAPVPSDADEEDRLTHLEWLDAHSGEKVR